MFDGIEDYNLKGTPKKNYGCMIISLISVGLILFGIFIGYLIF
jgi:hypothetical protein